MNVKLRNARHYFIAESGGIKNLQILDTYCGLDQTQIYIFQVYPEPKRSFYTGNNQILCDDIPGEDNCARNQKN